MTTKTKRRRTFRGRVRRTLAILFGLYLGWSVAGVAFNELNASPAQPSADQLASAAPAAGDDAAEAAKDDKHEHHPLVPHEDTSWHGGVIAAAIGLFILAIAAGLIFGENPAPPPAHHDDHGDHDDHGHDDKSHGEHGHEHKAAH